MAIVRWSDPFREFSQLQEQLNRVVTGTDGPGDDGVPTSGSWVPPVDIFQNGDRGFSALQGESLLPHEARVQEVLELFSGDQVAQGTHTRFVVELPVVGFRLHALL